MMRRKYYSNVLASAAFTLAEVLITLVIIGVIAAMTVPTLMNNTNGQEYRSSLKKSISAVNQALVLNYALESVSANDIANHSDLVNNLFKKRMNIIEGQESFTTTDCSGSVFTTADGVIYCVDSSYKSELSDERGTACDSYNEIPCTDDTSKANLWIDVNGLKKPNRATASASRPRDIYQAQIYAQKVVPYGAPTQRVLYEQTSNNAAEGDNSDEPLDCTVTFQNGRPVMTCK